MDFYEFRNTVLDAGFAPAVSVQGAFRMAIPDWAWKLLTSLIIPILLWAIATHVASQSHDLRINQLEQKIVTNDQKFQVQEKSIQQTEQDIEILKVRMEYVAKGIDDIKSMLEEKQ
jgi:septal ring factor EnvC (AmiA/AmiB activator)